MRRKRNLFLLLLLALLFHSSDAWRFNRQSDDLFEFTAPLYNLTLEENALGSRFAKSENATKIGVHLPDRGASCKFRVAEVAGEKSALFKAHARQVGDFVFLRIRYKGDNPLNRELKDAYDMLVKATCKRRDSTNLETTTRVALKVADRNDASPVFLVADAYEATIDDQIEPFSKVLQVEASDADIGINSEIYFSLVNRSHEFFVDAVSGWVRTLRPLRAGSFSLKVRAEDRASRLAFFDDTSESNPSWTADIKITVTETSKKQPKVVVEEKRIDDDQSDFEQIAAIINVQDSDSDADVQVGLADDDLKHWFRVERSDDMWILYTVPGMRIPDGTNVTVTVGGDVARRRDALNTTAIIRIEKTIVHGIEFGEKKLLFEVNELAPLGTVIGYAKVGLKNSQDSNLIRYSLESKDLNATSPFTIGAKSGALRVESLLDFEKDRRYEFNVIAKLDGLGQMTVAPAEVKVLDGNDHSPVWAAKWMRQAPIAIPDGATIGTVLLKANATDRDEGENGRVGYKLAAEGVTPLRVGIDNGEITIASPLPKHENEWNVSIWAIDWGTPLSRASALNLVFYRNGSKVPPKPKPVIVPEPKNEHAPTFVDLADVVDVDEDAPIGTVVTRLNATDADAGYGGLVRFAVWDDRLDVDAATGVVRVARRLGDVLKEQTTHAEIQVKVSAQDAGNPPKRSDRTFKLRVKDANDHAPQFEQPWYRVRVSEDAKVGSEILKVSALDVDGGENGRVGYRIASDADKLVEIDARTGVLKIVKSLDREWQDVIRYTIIAHDFGKPQRSSFANLTIELDDVNDNPPICIEQVFKARIPEDYPDGAFVTCISARDADVGANARLRFSIEPPPGAASHRFPFRIDHHTGCVFVHAPREPLDFHRTSSYNLSIDVADNGDVVLSTACQLHVELIDVGYNHEALEFDDIAKEASVYENSPPGTEVIAVTAKDADDKQKSPSIQYSIIAGDGRPFFNIDSKGMVRTLAVLDREVQASYWLTIEAHDDVASGRRTAVVHVYVRVLDRNDHRPTPKLPVYFASVKENSPANVIVVKVEASDADDVENAEAPPLQFRIERGDPQSFFRIDPNSGYITTSGSRKLDREKQAEHELWILVCDGGDPQLCSQVPVIVQVEDENDNEPMFTQPIHHFNVRSQSLGPLCRVFASDVDEGLNAELTYNITEGDARFTVDKMGIISSTKAIQDDESFAMTVQASDGGSPPKTTATRVMLSAVGHKKNANNRKPSIVGKKTDYVIPVSDKDQVGLTIGKLEATDDDGDELWWRISGGNVNETFDIRSDSGALLLARKADTLRRGEIRLNVTVSDGVDEDSTTVVIQVSRLPSMRPKFSASHYHTEVTEKTAVGTQVYTLKATGEDLGPGTKPLVFSMFSVEQPAMEDKIRIEPSTGNVLIMEPLDYELSREIRAVVSVRQASLANYATLVVRVTDDNDNAPRFIAKKVYAYVDETDDVDSLVATVVAFDADSGDNGLVTYSVVSGNEHGLFTLDSLTGEIRLKKKLIAEEHVETILTIRARDRAKYPLSDTAVVHIQTNNLTSQPKVRFSKRQFHVSIRDSTRPGTPLLGLTAQYNGLVAYSLRQPCPYFEIHSISGAIRLSKWLTKERAKSVSCTAIAETNDGGSDEAKVMVKIIATNQHAPLFKQQVYRAWIRENSPTGTNVVNADNSPLVVSAVDHDVGSNALIGYRLLAASDPYFSVDFVSGAVRSRKPIDFEIVREWQFYVQATDMGQPVRTSPLPTLVIVSVVDENDETPIFEKTSVEASPVLLPTVNGVVVSQNQATDSDTVGKLRYFVKDSDALKNFSIDSNTGVVSTANAKQLTEGDYKMTVFVSDGARSASYELVVPVRSTSSSSLRFPQKEYVVSVVENTTHPFGKPLLAVTAIGAPPTTTLVYKILNENPGFFMNTGTGIISLTGVGFDRELESIIRLVVQARTQGSIVEHAQAVVVVRIEDVNDCSPMFVNLPYDAVVAFDAVVDDRVLTIRAQDKDSAANGRVQYSSSNIPSEFKLTSADGKILVANKLTPATYVFDVVAEDQGSPSRKSSQKVRIVVVDKAQPIFAQNNYEVTIGDTRMKGSTVATVKAKSNVNGHVGYRIAQESEDLPFHVNWQTGEVKLSRGLDADSDLTYNVAVEAVDATRPNVAPTKTNVVVKVSAAGQPPVFNQSAYNVNVLESTPIGHVVFRASARSHGASDDVSYAAIGVDSQVVAVDASNGDVRLAKSLDYEKKKRYEITLLASNRNQLQAETLLVLGVDDVNDEPPVFQTPFATAHVVDSASPSQFITIMSVTDEDSVSSLVEGQRFLYSIIDGDQTLFDVNKINGEVTLSRAIEDEDLVERTKMLNVSVTDGVFTAYGQLNVEVTLSGLRQPPPRFEQSQYVVTALENSPLSNKTALLTVAARDGVTPLKYSLGSASSAKGKESWPVKMDRSTGRVHAARVFNFHTENVYQIPLTVEDALGRRAFSTLTLNVQDRNDVPPKFVLSKYTSSVTTLAKEGDTVMMLSATDDDEMDHIEYSLMGEAESSMFEVHPKQGTVTVAKKLEGKAGHTFTFMVKATDSANPPHHATCNVEINVAAEGTPVPRFSNSHYFFAVPEDAVMGTVIGRVQQVETDVEEVRFVLADQSPDLPFSVERSSGKIIVRAALDRERRAQWRLAIRADAAGGVHATTTVTIDVADVNDNAPTFHGSYDRLSIYEDAPVGTSVAIFSATDKDRAPGGRIKFSLLETTSEWAVDADSGWLTASTRLDRETKDSYKFTARATDEGGLNTDVKFTIDVLDVNDSPPVFDEKTYTVDVDSSQLEAGQTVAHVRITDADLDPYNISRLYVRSGNEAGIFQIDDSGKVSVKYVDMLKARHELVLLAFDGAHTSTARMIVNVKAAPKISCPEKIVVSVKETARKGDVVVGDSLINSSTATYVLLSEEKEMPFVIDSKTGVVAIADALDFEKTIKYTLTRKVTSKVPSAKCVQKIVVDVVDENDNSPVFVQREQTVSIKENLPATDQQRQFVTRVEANDGDSGDLGRVRYELADGFGTFKIDERSGVITAVKSLDRESRADYTLHVLARDSDPENQRNAKAVIHVSAADQNDNAPVFEKKLLNLKVMESESVGYQIAKLDANGGDDGETVTFRLKPSEHNRFVRLGEKTGSLTLAEGLDYEKVKALHLVVEAVDSGSPPLTADAQVDIEVMDENDNAPIFDKTAYKSQVKENSKNGTKVVKTAALDADSEHLGRVAYKIRVDAGESVPFGVDDDGWIFVKGLVDYEKKLKYSFVVEAKDGGDPPLHAEVAVDVEVLDENDNAPVIDDCNNMTAVVQEGVPPGHVVLTVAIRDADGPGNGAPFNLEIRGTGAKAFKFDENSNLVTMTRLHNAKKDRFLLTVVAEDAKGKSSDCPLTIFVKEESRHAPVLNSLRVSINTLMKEFKAAHIGRLHAVDKDSDDLLRYALVEGSTHGPLPTEENPRPESPTGRPHNFRVDANSGQIWADHSIPAGLHVFNVTVTDGKFSAVSYVEVEVSSLDRDMIDHAVAVRIREMTADVFFAKHEKIFRRILSRNLNVQPEDIHLISVQQVPSDTTRFVRAAESKAKTDVEVLLTAKRGHNRGLLKPDHIYSRLKQDFQSNQDQIEGMRYQLTTEMCTPGVCPRGECRENIEMLEDRLTFVASDTVAYISPHHVRSAECLCPEGYGGRRCENEVNECARVPCDSWQMCIPGDVFPLGFECVCPLGMSGDKCQKAACDSDGKCFEEAEISVGGTGYFEMSLANEVETRMELEVELKTTSVDGVIMSSSGEGLDYHVLRLVGGYVEYAWNAGSGEGSVKSKVAVADGKWHRIGVSRRQRRTRLTVDESDVQESFSPPGALVLNLHSYAQKLIFGASVQPFELKTARNISNGIIACFRTISVDGRVVPKTRQGLRFWSVSPGCSAMASSPCGEGPCQNGGTCAVVGRSFTCFCNERYTGERCEIDKEPCESRPCPNGIQCIQFYNDYLCQCPSGFTGKQCESRGYVNECTEDRCGDGKCVPLPRQNSGSNGFICNCTGGILQSKPCQKEIGLFMRFTRFDVVVGFAVLALILCSLCIALVICRCCCRRNSDPKYGAHVDVPSHVRNTRVLMPVTSEPPPIPPRANRNDINISSGNGNINRPTVQVRPFANNVSRNESRSPSIAGSGKANRRGDLAELDKLRNLDALRRFGQRISSESSGGGTGTVSGVNRVRQSDRRYERPFLDALSNLNQQRDFGDSIQCLATGDGWRDEPVSRRDDGRLRVGNTELTPVYNDDDYMTMRPRASSQGDRSSSDPPTPPAHKTAPLMETSQLYDEPATASMRDDDESSAICDIDDSDVDEEVVVR